MKKQITILAAILVMGTAGISQATYKNAIGARVGSTYYDLISFSYKTFISRPGALEFNAGFGSKGYRGYGNPVAASLSAAYQHHFNIKGVSGLKWFVGGGLVLYNAFSKYDAYKGFGAGLFPTGGADYKFPKIPLNVSADIRPTVYVTTPEYYKSFYGNYGLSARYTIN
ncbi:MAG: hypothetical protein V4722_04865 [Bacteroidota bacterium]